MLLLLLNKNRDKMFILLKLFFPYGMWILRFGSFKLLFGHFCWPVHDVTYGSSSSSMVWPFRRDWNKVFELASLVANIRKSNGQKIFFLFQNLTFRASSMCIPTPFHFGDGENALIKIVHSYTKKTQFYIWQLHSPHKGKQEQAVDLYCTLKHDNWPKPFNIAANLLIDKHDVSVFFSFVLFCFVLNLNLKN